MRWLWIVVAITGCSRDARTERTEGLPPATEWHAGSGALAAPVTPRADKGVRPHGPIGTDVSKSGLPAPDPKRVLDPSHHVAGAIRLAPAIQQRATVGGAVFVIARRADAAGQPSGPPLAVQKLQWADPLAFELTERQAMIAGTQLVGDVVVMARYDQDGDALTKQPGDLTGAVRVTIPATTVELVLDSVLP